MLLWGPGAPIRALMGAWGPHKNLSYFRHSGDGSRSGLWATVHLSGPLTVKTSGVRTSIAAASGSMPCHGKKKYAVNYRKNGTVPVLYRTLDMKVSGGISKYPLDMKVSGGISKYRQGKVPYTVLGTRTSIVGV